MVDPCGGRLIMAALVGARYYTIGARKLPAACIEPRHLEAELRRLGVRKERLHLVPAEAAAGTPSRRCPHGYAGIALYVGRRAR